jgi:1,4-dihydroxy-2-naphthoate octaprenyltransferase
MEITLAHWSESRWRVLQPAIYLISILPVLVCALIFPSSLSHSPIFLVGLAVVLIQHAINVFNDETDWEKGADTEKTNSWFHFHQGNTVVLKIHAWLSLLAGVSLGMALVLNAQRGEILWVALPLVLLGFLYNFSHLALSYTQWGEWVTGLCYGPGVFGCMAYFIRPEWSFHLIAGSLAFGALAVAVLLSHQPPQVLTDFAAGKMSFAVRHGVDKTYQVARRLTLISLILLTSLFLQVEGGAFSNLVRLLICLYLGVRLPQRLSPPVILKVASLLIIALGLFVKVSA